MVTIVIDTRHVAQHVKRLEAYHKSAYPVVVRQTLNRAAIELKTLYMPAAAKAAFIQRKATFFQSNSRAELAHGFNISSMYSLMGFIPKPNAKDTSVSDLEQQENGGNISGRAYIPLAPDRVGNKWTGNVKTLGRITKFQGNGVNKIADSEKSGAAKPKGRFISTAKFIGAGGIVIGNRRKGAGRIAWKIISIEKTGRNRAIKMSPLFSVQGNRIVSPPATHFMRKASDVTALRLDSYFIFYANKRLKKIP